MSYNVLRQFVGTGEGGVGGVLVLLTFGGGGGGVVQNREFPDFRSPEVGRYVMLLLNGWNFKAVFDQFISNPLAMVSE